MKSVVSIQSEQCKKTHVASRKASFKLACSCSEIVNPDRTSELNHLNSLAVVAGRGSCARREVRVPWVDVQGNPHCKHGAWLKSAGTNPCFSMLIPWKCPTRQVPGY